MVVFRNFSIATFLVAVSLMCSKIEAMMVADLSFVCQKKEAVEPKPTIEKVTVLFKNAEKEPLQIRVHEVCKEDRSDGALLLRTTLGVADPYFQTSKPLPYEKEIARTATDWEVDVAQFHKRVEYGSAIIPADIVKKASIFCVNRCCICMLGYQGELLGTRVLFRKIKE